MCVEVTNPPRGSSAAHQAQAADLPPKRRRRLMGKDGKQLA